LVDSPSASSPATDFLCKNTSRRALTPKLPPRPDLEHVQKGAERGVGKHDVTAAVPTKAATASKTVAKVTKSSEVRADSGQFQSAGTNQKISLEMKTAAANAATTTKSKGAVPTRDAKVPRFFGKITAAIPKVGQSASPVIPKGTVGEATFPDEAFDDIDLDLISKPSTFSSSTVSSTSAQKALVLSNAGTSVPAADSLELLPSKFALKSSSSAVELKTAAASSSLKSIASAVYSATSPSDITASLVSKSSSTSSQWACSICTYLNPPLAPICAMCNERKKVLDPDDTDDIEKASRLQPSKSFSDKDHGRASPALAPIFKNPTHLPEKSVSKATKLSEFSARGNPLCIVMSSLESSATR
jgi:hypothetical protein